MNSIKSEVWSKCLTFIKDNIPSQAFKTWFEPIEAIKLEDNVLSIQVPSKFFYEWLEEHYVTLLKSVFWMLPMRFPAVIFITGAVTVIPPQALCHKLFHWLRQ